MTSRLFESINPATGDVIQSYSEFSPEALDAALGEGVNAQRQWKNYPIAHRSDRLRMLACLLRARQPQYARLMALEMGKVLNEGEAEIEKCARVCEWFAEQGPDLIADRPVRTEAVLSTIRYRPLGLVLAVMPWNFPFWQVFRCAIPALLTGNGLMLKHAPNVCGCALALEELFHEADFPAGLCRTLLLDVGRVPPVVEDDRIAAVTFTGSVGAGRAVASVAGRALKKCVLELGGSDPFIVLADADLDATVSAAVTGRFQNCGQSCIAAKRFIILDSIRDAFVDRFLAQVRKLRSGDPSDRATQLGPMARGDLRARLHEQVERSIAMGARCLLNGEIPEGPGFHYPPTVLDRIPETSPAWQDELFGPAAAVISVPTEADAIRAANATPYGLAASVWTRDLARGQRIADAIESGMCFVNRIPASDPRLPFGGIKRSGFGRELSDFGLHEFANINALWIEQN
jgi:succinate-semialdehyde dehydrogenase/glutarate-semialdehyde dehydrogenase